MTAAAGPARAVSLVIPGSIETLTGGYLYDRRMLEGLQSLGRDASVVRLDASFPSPSAAALLDARQRLERLAGDSIVVIDGLALAGLLPLLPELVARHDCFALIHHPLADETGLVAGRAARLRRAEQSALALVPRVIVTSPWTGRRLADYGVAAGRIAVVMPGVDARPVRDRRPGDRVRLLCVATVTPRKGHALLVEAMARLRGLDWSLNCVGSLDLDPGCVADLRRQIDAAGLADRIELCGELEPARLLAQFADSDLFVLASGLEGYGMALSEAIASGLPVISTAAGAVPETVPAAASRLVPPGDVDALSEALRDVLSDRAALAALADAARSAAADARRWDDAIAEFDAVLDGPAP